MELLRAYDWPGSVRELQNVIERAVVLCSGYTFTIEESWLKTGPRHPSRRTGIQVTTLAEGEKALIEAALAESHGRVSGPGGARPSWASPAKRSSRKSRPPDRQARQRPSSRHYVVAEQPRRLGSIDNACYDM
jgi:transcriptional regulator with GAF, ATPase, and Fis domain